MAKAVVSRSSKSTRVATALLAPFVLLLSAIALTATGLVGDALLERDSSGDFDASCADVIIALVAGVLSGWYVIPPLVKRTRAAWPSVRIGDSSPRWWRLTKRFRLALVSTPAAAIIAAVLVKLGIPAT